VLFGQLLLHLRVFVFPGINMIPDSSAEVPAVHFVAYHATSQILLGDKTTTVLFVYIFTAVRITFRKQSLKTVALTFHRQ